MRDTFEGAPADAERRVEHVYRNYVYGYSVEIPYGIVGVGSRPPAPQHGFGIDLDDRRVRGELALQKLAQVAALRHVVFGDQDGHKAEVRSQKSEVRPQVILSKTHDR